MASHLDPSEASHAITHYDLCALEYSEAKVALLEHEDRKPVFKDAAVKRIMASKSMSYSAAEREVELDPTYETFLRQRRDAVGAEALAFGKLMVAKLRAELAIALHRGL